MYCDKEMTTRDVLMTRHVPTTPSELGQQGNDEDDGARDDETFKSRSCKPIMPLL